MKKLSIILLLVGIVFIGCKNKHYYKDKIEIPDGKWEMSDIVKFDVTIDDNSIPYNLFIDIIHDKKYPYKNLWLFIKTTAPNGNIQYDSLNCILTDEEFNWKGSCTGDNCEYLVSFKDSVSFIEKGDYIFEIQQALRQNEVEQIDGIGLVIDKINNL